MAVRAIGMSMMVDRDTKSGDAASENEQIDRGMGAERLQYHAAVGVDVGHCPAEHHAGSPPHVGSK